MSDNPVMKVTKRTEFGKGAARRIRRSDQVPAVLYGSGTDPVHLTLPGHDTMLALKVSNALIDLDIEGTRQLALVKDVQRDPLKPFIKHLDLVVVRRGEKVTVEVAVHVTGEAAPETVVTTENTVLEVEAEATNIPESFEVSVEGAEAGTQYLASEVKLPAGVTLVSDPELLVVNVSQAITAEALDAELEAAEAEAGIEREDSDEDAAEGEGGDDAAEGDGDSDAKDSSDDE
ncbi:50S ribosomal protein L25/general stress protein Ctc [Mobilicoccus caccae]|uniref:Large ribosomal subunit protein bL25 n=1 Tax=Mobilicoccus caccae TaxID=1859295 RepID=A0ABQ6ITT5_9MICO|nr:50S ribosomal protein L25/general stress protein Ctc [Mobilicoccus caccae]GMA40708.1 50S ribosomal protein L25 [Mobilicoccus caccae]